MGRSILGVVAGYVVMFIVVFATFTAAYLIMGTEGAFQEGTFEPSTTWIAWSFILGLLAATLGGATCAALVGAGSRAPMALAGVVLILGLLMAIPVFMAAGDAEDPKVRTGDLSNFEAMSQAEQPLFVAVANPFVGAFGVLIGASVVRRKQSGPSGATTPPATG